MTSLEIHLRTLIFLGFRVSERECVAGSLAINYHAIVKAQFSAKWQILSFCNVFVKSCCVYFMHIHTTRIYNVIVTDVKLSSVG